MKIRFTRPTADGEFRFEASDFTGAIAYQLIVGGDVMKSGRCPDPPCHEILRIGLTREGQDVVVAITHIPTPPDAPRQRMIAQVVGAASGIETWNEENW